MSLSRFISPLAALLVAIAPGTRAADPMDWKDRIEQAIAAPNAEARQRQAEYHQYLVESGRDDGETLEEHLDRFVQPAKISGPADPADIDRLRTLSPLPLPDELLQFYRSAGGFDGGRPFSGTHVPSPTELLTMHRSKRPYERIRSIGLVDMIRASWGNDRFEFEAGSGEGLSEQQITALNSAYAVAGWRPREDGEAFEYLYFDAAGRFDILHYHQDDFETLYEDDLVPMVAGRAATLSFRLAIERWLTEPLDPDEDE